MNLQYGSKNQIVVNSDTDRIDKIDGISCEITSKHLPMQATFRPF